MSKNLKSITKTSNNEVTLEHIDGNRYIIDFLLIAKEEIDERVRGRLEYTFRDRAIYSNSNNVLYIPYDINTPSDEIIVLEHNLEKIKDIIRAINEIYLPINLEEDTDEVTTSDSKIMPRLKFGGQRFTICDTEDLCSDR